MNHEFEQSASRFIQEVHHMPDAVHPVEQLEHTETRLAEAQDAKANRQHMSFTYERKRFGPMTDIGIVSVTRDVFIAGMTKVSKALRNGGERK